MYFYYLIKLIIFMALQTSLINGKATHQEEIIC